MQNCRVRCTNVVNLYMRCNRVICKVMKTQHQNPSLVIHRVRLKKKPATKYDNIQLRVKLRKPSIFICFVVN